MFVRQTGRPKAEFSILHFHIFISYRCGFAKQINDFVTLVDNASKNLFGKTMAPHHCLHSLLPLETEKKHDLRTRGHNYPLPSANIICIGILFSQISFWVFNCFYSLSRFRSDLCDLFICTFVAYFIKLFWIWIARIFSVPLVTTSMMYGRDQWLSWQYRNNSGHWVLRERVRGSNPFLLNFQNFLDSVSAKYTLQTQLLCSLNPKFYTGKR